MREVAWFIARCGDGLLQPGNGFIVTTELNEIGTDIVVGIAEFWIDGDRAFTFRNGLINFPLKMISPAEKSVGLGVGKISRECLYKVTA